MLLIGVLTTLVCGCWASSWRSALGLIAGLLSFIPNIGPVLAVIPALLLASLEGGRTRSTWSPRSICSSRPWKVMCSRRGCSNASSRSPALTIAVQLLFGLLAGTLGLLLAMPHSAAVGMVLVRMLYVEDLLGDRPQATDGDSAQPLWPGVLQGCHVL